MSTTPAAELARLKVTYHDWLISRVDGATACMAQRRAGDGSETLRAPNPGRLEVLIIEAGPVEGTGRRRQPVNGAGS